MKEKTGIKVYKIYSNIISHKSERIYIIKSLYITTEYYADKTYNVDKM